MTIYSIYRVTNTKTGKIYIGFTSTRLSNRKANHKHKIYSQHIINKFYNAVRKYGWETFIWEIIYQSKESCLAKDSYTLTIMEDYFIKEYDSLINGYNSTVGGGKFPVTKGENHPLYNLKHSIKSKQKISNNHHDVSGSNNPNAKQIIIILPNGNKYESFGNLKEICDHINIPIHVIFNMLSNGRKVIIRGKRKGLQAYYKNHEHLNKDIIDDIIKTDIDSRVKSLNRVNVCQHCNIKTTAGNLKRWHGDRCKYK